MTQTETARILGGDSARHIHIVAATPDVYTKLVVRSISVSSLGNHRLLLMNDTGSGIRLGATPDGNGRNFTLRGICLRRPGPEINGMNT